ncbi:MAG: polyhydroxyalkanoate synthesis repressor PhaR [Alphaproteobacteria bacterium]|nr:polyhydroxyalkanoate synthesis repressor PhaR [Alphaproteobacteria bacterium]
MLEKAETRDDQRESVVIKKYANRRLYNTETSTYVTLDDLAEMVRSDRDFVVYDAKSGAELTHSVLTQIIVDQESKGQTLLPVPFLRQLIRFYGDSISRMVPTYLQFSMETLTKEQDRYRDQLSTAFGSHATPFEAYQEHARRNMAIFEQAMNMWVPFPNNPDDETAAEGDEVKAVTDAKCEKVKKAATEVTPSRDEIDVLKSQLAAMQQKIEKLANGKE